jgi:hypothetical protein
MKRILGIGVYKPGDLTSEVINLDDFKANIKGNNAVFTGHATVKSRFKGQDFSGFYQLSKEYEKQQEHWQVVASRTARLRDKKSSTAKPCQLPA